MSATLPLQITPPAVKDRTASIGSMFGTAGYALPLMTGVELKRTAIPNTLTIAARIDDAVLAARGAHADPFDAVLAVTGGERIFAGMIVDVQRRLLGGFTRGELRLDGIGTNAGRALRIDFQNENLIARTEASEVLAVVPDLIWIVDAGSDEPITTQLIRNAMRVVVLRIPAPATLKTPKALAVIGPAAFGCKDVPYVPLPAAYGDESPPLSS